MARTSKDDIIRQLQAQNEQLMAMIMRPQHSGSQSINVNTLTVGIKNISNNTIGLSGHGGGHKWSSPTPNEGDIQIPCARTTGDSGNRAVISYAWWRILSQSQLYRDGMLVRDDTALGPVDVAAPPDDPATLPPEAVQNQIMDAHAWITSRTDDAIRDDIARMTSEASLRRLQHTVDCKVQEFRVQLGCDGSTTDENIKREKAAARALPTNYALTGTLAEERLNELTTRLVA